MCFVSGLKIMRYDYSEAQSGKSFCDAKIAHMRSKMKMYVSTGNNILSAEDMRTAIMKGSGVTGCQCAVVEVDTTKQEMTSHRFKGVNSISNLEFDDDNIVMWHAYNIGIGKKLNRSSVLKQEQGETGLIIVTDFSEPAVKYGEIKSKAPVTPPVEAEPSSTLFECPEPGCVAAFPSFRDLENHQNVGRHITNLSTYDKIRKRWVESCEANFQQSVTIAAIADENCQKGTATVEQGWALRKQRKFNRFSSEVHNFLECEFRAGEESGKKSNPTTTAKNMRSKLDANGNRVFKAKQLLQPSQIASYFAKLSVNTRKKTLGKQRVEDERDDAEVEELMNIVRDIAEQEIREVFLNEGLQ